LASPDPDVRYHALAAVGWIGPDAAELTPRVLACLKHPDAGVRRKAAEALGRVAAAPDTATPALAAALADPHRDVRDAAGDALVQFGAKAVPALVAVLDKQPPAVCITAAEALGRIGPAAKDAIAPLVKMLLTPSDQETTTAVAFAPVAAEALRQIGKDAIPALAEVVKTGPPQCRSRAMETVAQIAAPETLPLFLAALQDADSGVCAAALLGLANVPGDIHSALPGVATCLKSGDVWQRTSAATLLGRMDAQAVPFLIDALEDVDHQVSAAAVQSASQLGPVAVLAGPALVELARTGRAPHQRTTVRAVLALGADGLPPLVEALGQEQDAILAKAVLWELDQSRVISKPALPFLLASLRQPSANVRLVAVAALGNLGPAAREAVPALTPLLNDPDPVIRAHTKDALENIRGN
jgi:HEAT repeat protein